VAAALIAGMERMSFPMPPRPAADAGPHAAAADDKSSILIVDDRSENLVVFRSMLEELGQDIVAVQSGEAALKQLLHQDFAVVLLDVNMPGMDGLETAGYIRQRRKTAHTPIIFLTAYIEEMHTAKGYSLGAVDYIMTPVMPEVLRTKVKVFVQLHQMQRHAQREAEHRIALAHEQAARAAAEESRRRFAFLAEASHVLTASLDADATAAALARFVVPFLADFGAVACLRGDDTLGPAAASWIAADDGAQRCNALLAPGAHPRIASAMRDAMSAGKPVLADRFEGGAALQDECSMPSLERALALPLVARGRTVGAMLLGIAGAGRDFDALAQEFATDLAGRVAISLDNCMLYARIQEQDQRKNEFLAMLAHELRNPLAPIRNAVQLLGMTDGDEARIAWATSVLDRQTRQLVRLVDDLLDVARITKGQITLKSEPVDVVAVLNTAVETCSSLIQERRHHLTVMPPPTPAAVRGDAARIAQILSNLLNNAVKYTDPGGHIALTANVDGDMVVFRVKDSGIGIHSDMLPNIFEVFTQASPTLDRTNGGLGVGLAIVQRLVTLHGGSVEALSAGLNSGSEFVVRLPLASGGPEAQAAGGMRVVPVALPSVLVVDDYIDSADAIASLLRAQGHAVHVCHDGALALQIAREVRPDVVLLDIGLPGMSGFEVAKALRACEETNGCRLIALSGYGQPSDYEQSREAGFDHHLVKPADPVVLAELLAPDNRTPG
jgi:signal transduction histidine kinase/DNA-binding response OmpR family regulator